jgi:hypothetical protein
MTSTTYTHENLTLSDEETHKSAFDKIAKAIPGRNFAKIREKSKKGIKGWLDDLLDLDEAKAHIRNGGNVALKLGPDTGYVAIDVERQGALNDAQSIVDRFSLVTWISPHGGRNRLLKVADDDTYQLIRSFDDNDKEDLEIQTAGGIVIPPSRIDHTECSDNKIGYGCPDEGIGHYQLQSVNPEAEPISKDEAEKIGEILDIKPSEEHTTPPNPRSKTYENVPSPTPTFNIEERYKEKVPHVNHTFDDRKRYMMYGDWKGQEEFAKLFQGDFTPISGSNPQGRAECSIAYTVGFFFGRDEKIVRLFMDSLRFDTDYQKYEQHRGYLLDKATEGPIYHEGVSFSLRAEVAQIIRDLESTTVNEITELCSVGKRQVQNVIKVLEIEGSVTFEKLNRNDRKIHNNGINEEYLSDIDRLVNKYWENDNV